MVFAEFDRRVDRARAHRTKLLVQMLMAFSYGALGVALAEPIVRGAAFGAGHAIALAAGLVCTFAALYLVPRGERHEP